MKRDLKILMATTDATVANATLSYISTDATVATCAEAAQLIANLSNNVYQDAEIITTQKISEELP